MALGDAFAGHLSHVAASICASGVVPSGVVTGVTGCVRCAVPALRAAGVAAMLCLNTSMLALFVRALATSTSVFCTATAAATNFVVSVRG